MERAAKLVETGAYLNPVIRRDFPDPFVLRYRGEYWAYCTGFWPDGRCFGIMHSRDLVHWQEVGGALAPFDDGSTCYWAPEVSVWNGCCYLYYSVGNEVQMQIRVAVAEHPAGPFVDSGRRLTQEPFAIDAHVFEDEDGRRSLFYATDFLEHTHIGTGTVVDQLLDPFTLAGTAQPVTRARYDWQVYDPQRKEKGGVRWHTVEGPFVLKHKGRYYQMFSGGNWQNITYGVSYALADTLERAEEWTQHCDGERVFPILRTRPEANIIGPGHNSVIMGPDNQQLFCVYHRWAPDGSGRQMAIDRLDWVGERITILGPTHTPQPAPTGPTFVDFFEEARTNGLGTPWVCKGGTWSVQDSAAQQTMAAGEARATIATNAAEFVVAVTGRALLEQGKRGGGGTEAGQYGVGVGQGEALLWQVWVVPSSHEGVIRWQDDEGWHEQRMALPPDFEAGADQPIHLKVNGRRVAVQVAGNALRWEGWLADQVSDVALLTQEMAARFAGFSLTVGWEDDFMQEGVPLSRYGWGAADQGAAWQLRTQQLWHAAEAGEGWIVKGTPLEAYEVVINARLGEGAAHSGYGFAPALTLDGDGPLCWVVQQEDRWVLQCEAQDNSQLFLLPTEFDPTSYQQFRCRKIGGQVALAWEQVALGVIAVPETATRIGVGARHAAAFDKVRVTALGG